MTREEQADKIFPILENAQERCVARREESLS